MRILVVAIFIALLALFNNFYFNEYKNVEPIVEAKEEVVRGVCSRRE